MLCIWPVYASQDCPSSSCSYSHQPGRGWVIGIDIGRRAVSAFLNVKGKPGREPSACFLNSSFGTLQNSFIILQRMIVLILTHFQTRKLKYISRLNMTDRSQLWLELLLNFHKLEIELVVASLTHNDSFSAFVQLLDLLPQICGGLLVILESSFVYIYSFWDQGFQYPNFEMPGVFCELNSCIINDNANEVVVTFPQVNPWEIQKSLTQFLALSKSNCPKSNMMNPFFFSMKSDSTSSTVISLNLSPTLSLTH